MPTTAARARSPERTTASPLKKAKIEPITKKSPLHKQTVHTNGHSAEDHVSLFTQNLFNPENIHRLNNQYHSSEPYKYGLVDKLFDDELLKKVVDECLGELHFTERETDIYKVRRFSCSRYCFGCLLCSIDYLLPCFHIVHDLPLFLPSRSMIVR